MYEHKTFEAILSNMLTRVSEQHPDLDTRTGSIIYTALAPMALELETAYHEMDMILNEVFMDTASKEYLVKHGNQVGVELISATYGHYQGEFDVEVELGSRFSLDTFNYNVIAPLDIVYETNEDGSYKLDENNEKIPKYYTYELVCETEGSTPNNKLGTLIPITYVANLTHSQLTSVLIYGEDEEETEPYRNRIFSHIQQTPVDGNVAQYNEWLNEYPDGGIGKYNVTPCWNGKNTVKLSILNTENRAASDELIKDVQNYFDPPTDTINDDTSDNTYPQGRGMGNGKAPIGAIITVDTVTEVPVVINCQLKLKGGYTSPIGVQEAVDDYIKSIALNKTTIGYMPISAEIYNAESVDDVLSLTITVNGTVMDAEATPFIDSVTIGSNEIAVLDTENSVWSV